MVFTLDLILTCLLLAMVVGGVAGWLTAMYRSRTREQALRETLEMQGARMESAERNVAALSERLTVARGEASTERGRSRSHVEDLGTLTEEVRYRDALIAKLRDRVKVLEKGETAQIQTLSDALEQARAHAAEIRQARATLVSRFEKTLRRKKAENAALRAALGVEAVNPEALPEPETPVATGKPSTKNSLRLV